MSSDKAPEKAYFVNDDGAEYVTLKPPRGTRVLYTYVREDLIPKPEIVQDLDEFVYQRERRREMYEKVALSNFNGFDLPDVSWARELTEKLLSESDKFARGEE